MCAQSQLAGPLAPPEAEHPRREEHRRSSEGAAVRLLIWPDEQSEPIWKGLWQDTGENAYSSTQHSAQYKAEVPYVVVPILEFYRQ